MIFLVLYNYLDYNGCFNREGKITITSNCLEEESCFTGISF